MEGNYKIFVKYGSEDVAKSPFNVYIEGKVGDSSMCRASGPGIEPTGVVVDKPTWFEVDTSSNFQI
jgi:filamin